MKKAYRSIRDKNFLLIANMPLLGTREEVLQWMKHSEMVRYAFRKCRDEFAVIPFKQDDGTYTWQGINYGEERRSLESDSFTVSSVDLIEAIFQDEIDLMPPLKHKYFGEKFELFNSEVILFLISKKCIWNLMINVAVSDGLLIENDDGTWIGKNRKNFCENS